MLCGGCWLNDSPTIVSAAYHPRNVPLNRYLNIGFRCARIAD